MQHPPRGVPQGLPGWPPWAGVQEWVLQELPEHPAQPCRFMSQAFSPVLLLVHQTPLLLGTPPWEQAAGEGSGSCQCGLRAEPAEPCLAPAASPVTQASTGTPNK